MTELGYGEEGEVVRIVSCWFLAVGLLRCEWNVPFLEWRVPLLDATLPKTIKS